MPETYFLVVGILLMASGISCLAVQINRCLSCSVRVTAQVVSVQRKRSNYWRGKTFYQYFPTFTYQVQGKSFTVRSTHPAKSANAYPKGDEVVIRYNPKAPEDVYTGGNVFAYISGLLLSTFGIFLMVCFFL